ncbi:MAG: hypothetical protein ACRYG8_29410 [Janthinobacterium lividum]
MDPMSELLVRLACFLAVAGVTCAASYWLIGRLLGTAAEAPDVAQPQLDDLPADRKD